MEVSLFVRPLNSLEYSKMGVKEFQVLPRMEEFISAAWDGNKKYFQVVAIHHGAENDGAIEIYAVQTEPLWEVKKGRSIGFGPSGK